MNTEALTLANLPSAERDEINRWLEAFAAMSGNVTQEFDRIAAQLGSTPGTVKTRYYRWLKEGLTGLVNLARNPQFALARSAGLHPDTIEEYRRFCIENGRKSRQAYKKLVRHFFAGQDVPGVPHGNNRRRLPEGWSEDNFRRHTPTPFECKAARQGLRAAAEFLPLVYTSRREMYLFQELQFDDVWHDVEAVLFGGRNQRVRPMQLGAMDVFTACLIEWCIKARIRRDDDTRVNLGKYDTLFLLAAMLAKFGHNPRGTRLNFEGGTATLPGEAIDLIHKLSGGQIVCRIGQASNNEAFLGQYRGAAKGNFRTRALIESFWNLTHNETADRLQFPGQTGANARLNAPEDLVGRGKAMDLMLRAMPALPEWVFSNLRKPLPEFTEAVRAIGEINERMNMRGSLPGTEHAIEGFIEAGLVTTDFDWPGMAVMSRAEFEDRLHGKSDEERAAIVAFVKAIPRKMSPREAFNHCAAREQLKRWRRAELALLLYPARREKIEFVTKAHEICFQDQDIAPSILRFDAARYEPGDAFEVVCNPLVPDLLFIYDARPSKRGIWVDVLKGSTVSRADEAAVKERMAEAERSKAHLLAPVVKLGDRLTEQRLADTEHNNRVLQDYNAGEQAAADEARKNLLDAFE